MIDDLPPLSLYVHLPYCIRKCPYCDFNSHKAGDAPPLDRYIKALLTDLRGEADRATGRTISTVFIGGGTPSLFSGAAIDAIISGIDSCMALAADAEITMEANPGTVERGDAAAYRRAGVNRLSLGAQSFDAGTLSRLGRIHGPQEILSAYRDARDAGFDNINVDIMFALPGQDLRASLRDVEQAIALEPQHISYYQLTLEPNTVFHSAPPGDLPDEELCWSIQQAGHDRLRQAGYEQYEISAFSRPENRCAHNLNYWQFGDYLAAGAGAHGKITDGAGRVRRYQKPAHPLTYMEQSETGGFEIPQKGLAGEDIAFEYMLNILRLPGGFSQKAFRQRTGLPPSAIGAELQRARSDGLMQSGNGGRWWPTGLGLRFLNDLQARFLPEKCPAKAEIDQELSKSGVLPD